MLQRNNIYTYIGICLMAIFLSVTIWPNTCLYGATTSNSTAKTLTIEEAILLAYKNDPDVKKTELTVKQAQITRDEAMELVTFIPEGGLVSPQYQQVFNAFQQAEIALEAAKKAQANQKDLMAKNVIAAYTKVVKDANNLEVSRLSLAKLQKQMAITKSSKELGMLSTLDWQAFERGLKQAEDGVKAAEATYLSSCLALNALTGQSKDATYELVSRPIIDKIAKNSLDQEYSRATDDAVLVWRAEQLLAIEQSKEFWFLPNVSSDEKKLSLSQAELDYEVAKRDARSTVESLYYGIEAMERQILVAMENNNQAQENLKIAELKYRLGTIPLVSASGQSDLMSARIEAEKTKATLENLRADLANTKAQFYYITGRTVYDSADWTQGSGSTVDLAVLNNRPETGKRISFAVGANTYQSGNERYPIDTPVYIKDGRSYVPVRYLGEALGAKVEWDPDTQTATLTKGAQEVKLTIGDHNLCVNGKYQTMDVAPEMVTGRTMLPARYVAESFGALVNWNDKTQEIVIFS